MSIVDHVLHAVFIPVQAKITFSDSASAEAARCIQMKIRQLYVGKQIAAFGIQTVYEKGGFKHFCSLKPVASTGESDSAG
ncbi:MAG: hypothetical protein WA609_12705 [Terriglobales bacterium]